MDCKSKAALYVRVSTEEQAAEGQSISAQIETLTQYCKLYSIEVYDTYKDLGLSGKKMNNRPELLRMLQDAKFGKFNMVLVWKISRLSRSLKDLLMIIEELEKSDIVFSSYSEKFDTASPVGKMTLQLLGSIAEFERNTIVDNVRLGLREYARKGGKTGNVLGYDRCSKMLVVNNDEADLVRTIFSLYTINKMSMSEIADHLNSLGCKTKRNHNFNKDSISVILGNPVYIGINRHRVGQENEHHIAGRHEPIIDSTTWDAAQQLRDANKKKRPARGEIIKFPLSGKLLCYQCNSPMYGFSSSSKGKSYKYYKCKKCKSLCNADIIDGLVIKVLQESLKEEASITNIALGQRCNIVRSNEVEFKFINREINNAEKQLDKYVMLLDRPELESSEVIISRIKELELEIVQLRKHLREMSAIDNRESNKGDNTEQILLNWDKSSVKALIDTLVLNITLSSRTKLANINFINILPDH